MEKRVIIATILSILVIILWQIFFYPTPKQTLPQYHTQPHQPQQKYTQQEQNEKLKKEEKEIPFKTNLLDISFTQTGGAIKKWLTKKYLGERKKQVGEYTYYEYKDNQPIGLIYYYSSPIITFGKSDENIVYNLTQKENEVIFTSSGDLNIIKSYKFFPDKYHCILSISLRNNTKKEIKSPLIISWKTKVKENENYTSSILSNEVYKRYKLGKDASYTYTGNIDWVALAKRIVAVALIPNYKVSSSLIERKGDTITISLFSEPISLEPNKEYSTSVIIYAGPQTYKGLKSMNVGLEKILHFGWFSGLGLILLLTLNFFYGITLNYGVAIICLTTLVKIILWWPSQKSLESMKKMQKIQPQIEELRKKYKNNPTILNQEIIKLYRTQKLNPLGGCLPMIIQIPIFFALYSVLSDSAELQGAPFILWIKDLSKMDPYFILAILLGVTMFIQQKMTPSSDPQQSKIMLIMPIVFTILFASLPSGVLLYWVVQNILSIIQQYYMLKSS
jgi:YidC/Oxa1 family membrane protein insertase